MIILKAGLNPMQCNLKNMRNLSSPLSRYKWGIWGRGFYDCIPKAIFHLGGLHTHNPKFRPRKVLASVLDLHLTNGQESGPVPY